MKVPALRSGRALLCAAFAATITSHTLAQAPNCPCTIWAPNAVPANAAVTDNRPIEVGVTFRSDVAGFVTAIRFYKGPQNIGTHVGHLWSAGGALLAEGTFTNETSSGWQELQLSPPIAISAQTTYVASYFSDGFFAIDSAYFATAGVDTPPLHALQSGVDGPNGVFRYDTSGFPSSTGNSANYWVDVVFQSDLGPDVTPPDVSSVLPSGGATGVALSSPVRANFSEAIAITTISASTFEVRDANGAQLSGTVAYDAGTRSATFATTAGLLPSTVFAASDTTVADFSAGTLDAQSAVAQTADGEVVLAPAAGSEFFGTALPADWSTLVWAPPNGGATVANGVLTVDGARTGTTAFYPAGRSLEFVATFGAAPFQHVGFSDTFDDAPFAMFTTWTGGLFVRTASSSGSRDTMLPSSLVGTPHRFRMEWTATGTTYLVDGTVVATHPVAFSVPLRPLVSDFTFGGNSVTVDWMRMSPYASAGTFLSRVFDGNAAVNWGSLSWRAGHPPRRASRSPRGAATRLCRTQRGRPLRPSRLQAAPSAAPPAIFSTASI